VHGRAGPADRLCERRKSADRPWHGASERNLRSTLTRRLKGAIDPATTSGKHGAFIGRWNWWHRFSICDDARLAWTRAWHRQSPAYSSGTGYANPALYAGGDNCDWCDIWSGAGAPREPSGPVGYVEEHGRVDCGSGKRFIVSA